MNCFDGFICEGNVLLSLNEMNNVLNCEFDFLQSILPSWNSELHYFETI